MALKKKVVIFQCVVCGSQTEWDTALGEEPLCVQCWDKKVDRQQPYMAALKYRQQNKEKIAAKQRLYREKKKGSLS